MPNFENPLKDVDVKKLMRDNTDDFAGKTIHWILNGNLDNYQPKQKGIAPQDGPRF